MIIKTYIFSDFQGEEHIPEGDPDLVIVLGDISNFYARKIDEKYSCRKIGVMGNHNSNNEWKGTEIEDIHNKVIEVNGYKFFGFGGSHTEAQCKERMDSLGQVDVFIAHSNPVYVELPPPTFR